jgi:predicted transcriptional regulator
MKGSVLEFSKAWGWDRDTVSRFLEKLQELGIVTMTLAGNRKAIKLNYITDKDF